MPYVQDVHIKWNKELIKQLTEKSSSKKIKFSIFIGEILEIWNLLLFTKKESYESNLISKELQYNIKEHSLLYKGKN